VPIVAHISTEGAFSSPKWYANVPEFVQGVRSSVEFAVEPFRASTLNLPHEAYLSAMILGGVFERHPNLRFGVIECGAQWVGPLAERLDMWAEQFASRLSVLSMKPSEYMVRHVRITPFVFEKVSTYFDRWPELIDIYAYSSDYPHVEGGRDSKGRFYDEISRFGDDVVNRFFYENAKTLLPA
jgi:predicted TIM-barrel fold metal-dependent hydrolase